jgi:hypothetical protein
MRPANVEVLMGHDIGVSEFYWRPTEQELLQDYLQAVPLLTVNEDNIVLQKRVEELTEKTKDIENIIKAKLQEKDSTIQKMTEKYDTDIALLKEAMLDMQQLLKNPERLTEISKASIQETS